MPQTTASSDVRPRRLGLRTAAVIVAGLAVFYAVVRANDDYQGAATAAILGGVATGILWALWRIRHRADRASGRLAGAPLLGVIPTGSPSPVPTLTQPTGRYDTAYTRAAERIERDVNGQILLVSSPAPGQGSSTVAMNLAIAATKAGRRAILIDGDPSSQGISRFGKTTPSPGLTELAAGTATLAEASRMWSINQSSRMPFIPAGSPAVDARHSLGSTQLADTIETLSDAADVVMVDVPPANWNPALRPLAAHADGTVLIVPDGSDLQTIDQANERLTDMGAPVVGYIVNRADEMAFGRRTWTGALWRGLATTLIAAVAFVGWNGYQIWSSWSSVERADLNVNEASRLYPLPAGGIVEPEIEEEVASVVTSPPIEDATAFNAYLAVGSDVGGIRADVIILTLIPSDGRDPILMSFPRDLYLPNRCKERYTRINENLAGCGDVSGTSMLALAVEDFTGIAVDHAILFDFDGFEAVIDEVGGIEICHENAVRDWRANLDMPAGCTQANGAQALSWVRSRHTEELVGGTWRAMSGVNDLTRNKRQQDMILALADTMNQLESPAELSRLVGSLAEAFTLDDGLSLGAAIDLAWSLRGLDASSIERIEIPVRNFRTEAGALVLVPTDSFESLLREIYPDLVREAV